MSHGDCKHSELFRKTHSSEPRYCHCSSMLQMLQIRQKPAAEDDRLSIKPKLYPFSGSILGVM